MSDKDLIRRGDVYEAIYALHADGKEGIMNAPSNSYGEDLRDVIDAIADIPAVPHEMTAVEFLKEHHRMCNNIYCEDCQICRDEEYPRSCVVLMGIDPDDTVAIVEKWAQEHSERSEDDGEQE